MSRPPLDPDELRLIDALLARGELPVRRPDLPDGQPAAAPSRCAPEHIKPRLLGHWGTTPGLNLVYAHLNRRDQGPRPARRCTSSAPATAARGSWPTPTSRAPTPRSTRTSAGTPTACAGCSGSSPSPAASPATSRRRRPGSIHEGGELGYALVHAYGAAFDNPDLVVACVVGDGEAETGPLAASWHSNKFLDPARDGAVLPILHLNGYKIANPTVLARIPEEELLELLRGYGHRPIVVSGDDPAAVHQADGRGAGRRARRHRRDPATAPRAGDLSRPAWPMIVLRTPKGWTGPDVVDGVQVEGTFRAHQVPLAEVRTNPGAPGAARGVAAQLPARGAVHRRRRAARGPRRAAAGRASGG